MKKGNAKKSMMDSICTPGMRVNIQTYLVELVMVRRNKGKLLPSKFWTELKWRGQFRREIMAINKAIKEYGKYCVIRAILNNFIDTLTDYQKFVYLVQLEMERLKRLGAPKDTRAVKPENLIVGPDLREGMTATSKRGLFTRLGELNG